MKSRFLSQTFHVENCNRSVPNGDDLILCDVDDSSKEGLL